MAKKKFNALTPPFDLVTDSISELTNDVTIFTPVVDDFLYYNGATWVNKELNATTYWLNDTLLSEAAYEISKNPNNGTEDIDTIIVNNNTNFLEGYITGTVLGINNLVAGNWKFNLYTSVDTANGITTISAKVMKRILGTAPTVDQWGLPVAGRLLVVTGTGTERNCYDSFGSNGSGFGFVPGDANTDPLLSNCVELNSATGTKGVFDIITYIDSSNVTIKVPADFVNSTSPFHPDYIIHKRLFTVTSDEINELTKTLHTINSSQPAYKLNVTDGTEGLGYQSEDKLSFRLYATTDNVANTTVSFYHNSISSSNIIAPINPYQVTLEQARIVDNILSGNIILNNNFLLSDTTGIGQIGFEVNAPSFYSGLVSGGNYSNLFIGYDDISMVMRSTTLNNQSYFDIASWGVDLGFFGNVGSGEIYIDDYGFIFYALGNTAIEIGANIGLRLPTEITNTLGVTGETTFSGALKMPIVSGGDITLNDTHYTYLANAAGANVTVTLPALAGITGRIYNIKKIDNTANTVTIDGNGAETIDGVTTKVLTTQYACITIQAGAAEWSII